MNPETRLAAADLVALGTAFVYGIEPYGHGAYLLYVSWWNRKCRSEMCANAIAVDTASPPNIYVTGFTGSSDFPGSADTSLAGHGSSRTSYCGSGFHNQARTFRRGAAQLAYSSYLGGDTYDQGFGIAVDATGKHTSWV